MIYSNLLIIDMHTIMYTLNLQPGKWLLLFSQACINKVFFSFFLTFLGLVNRAWENTSFLHKTIILCLSYILSYPQDHTGARLSNWNVLSIYLVVTKKLDPYISNIECRCFSHCKSWSKSSCIEYVSNISIYILAIYQ